MYNKNKRKDSMTSKSDSELSPIISPITLAEAGKKTTTITDDHISEISTTTLLDDMHVKKKTKTLDKPSEDTATTENDDDEGSIDSWAEEIINTDLPIIYHLIGELKKTQERLKKIAVKHSKLRKKRLVIQEP